MSRSEHAPLRIVPDLGQRAENSMQAPSNKRWGIFHEAVLGSYFANDALHVPPEPAALAVDPFAFARDRDVLARESAGNDIDSSSPWGSVEGGNVIVNLHVGGQVAIRLTRPQHASAVGVDLDGTHRSVAEQHASEDPTTRAGKQMKLSHFLPLSILWVANRSIS
jgi:hypothetical protein